MNKKLDFEYDEKEQKTNEERLITVLIAKHILDNP